MIKNLPQWFQQARAAVHPGQYLVYPGEIPGLGTWFKVFDTETEARALGSTLIIEHRDAGGVLHVLPVK